jgi:hypothetical protein
MTVRAAAAEGKMNGAANFWGNAMATSKPSPTSDQTQKPERTDTTQAHHPPAPRQPPVNLPRPGAKGQNAPRARQRVTARQRGPR